MDEKTINFDWKSALREIQQLDGPTGPAGPFGRSDPALALEASFFPKSLSLTECLLVSRIKNDSVRNLLEELYLGEESQKILASLLNALFREGKIAFTLSLGEFNHLLQKDPNQRSFSWTGMSEEKFKNFWQKMEKGKFFKKIGNNLQGADVFEVVHPTFVKILEMLFGKEKLVDQKILLHNFLKANHVFENAEEENPQVNQDRSMPLHSPEVVWGPNEQTLEAAVNEWRLAKERARVSEEYRLDHPLDPEATRIAVMDGIWARKLEKKVEEIEWELWQLEKSLAESLSLQKSQPKEEVKNAKRRNRKGPQKRTQKLRKERAPRARERNAP